MEKAIADEIFASCFSLRRAPRRTNTWEGALHFLSELEPTTAASSTIRPHFHPRDESGISGWANPRRFWLATLCNALHTWGGSMEVMDKALQWPRHRYSSVEIMLKRVIVRINTAEEPRFMISPLGLGRIGFKLGMIKCTPPLRPPCIPFLCRRLLLSRISEHLKTDPLEILHTKDSRGCYRSQKGWDLALG